MSLIAKQLVKNQSWIVTDGKNKVGNLESSGGGFSLNMGGKEQYFNTTGDIERAVPIIFQAPKRLLSSNIPFAVWPTTGKTYNNMFDIKRKLHVYTKTKKSRCYYAAGWFRLHLSDDTWQTILCPKYIFVQRYNYTGPYISKEEADADK
jgi:hypothetical protein